MANYLENYESGKRPMRRKKPKPLPGQGNLLPPPDLAAAAEAPPAPKCCGGAMICTGKLRLSAIVQDGSETRKEKHVEWFECLKCGKKVELDRLRA